MGRAIRVPPGCRRDTRRALAVSRTRRPHPRGSEGVRVSAAARRGAAAAHEAPDRSRRPHRHGRHARDALAHAAPARHPRRPVLRGGGALDAGRERRAARQRLDPARAGARGRPGDIATGSESRRRAGPRGLGEAPALADARVDACDTARPHDAVGARRRASRDVRRLGGDRVRRARRLPRPPAAALRHPVREQLFDRRHGVDTRARRDRGAGRSPSSSAAGCSSLASCSLGVATSSARSPAQSPQRSL